MMELIAFPSESKDQAGLDTNPALLRIPLLEGLSLSTMKDLSKKVHIRQIRRGQWVIRKGSTGDQLYFLLAGRLQVVDITDSGKEIGLSFLSRGDYFGELSVIDGLPRTSSVLAITDAEIATLSRQSALELMHNHPSVAERMLKNMASMIRNANAYRAILAITNANQRVYALLEKMVHLAPGGLHVIDPLPKQQEIAIMINTSRETVSRAIHSLINIKVIEKDLRRLIIRDLEKLQSLSKNNI